jgi:hypothetical protein
MIFIKNRIKMKSIKFTIFESSTNSKVPTSHYEDGTFVFNTIDVPINEIPFLIENFYYLNRGFSIKNKRLKRTKTDFEKYLNDKIEFIVLDIDKVYSQENLNSILEVFRKNNYPVIVCKSRSFNGVSNFNLKGVFLVDGYNNTNGIIEFLHKVQRQIGNIADVDLSSARLNALQAPTRQEDSLIYQNLEAPKPYIRIIERDESVDICQDNEILKLSLERCNLLGFSVVKEKEDMIILQHPNEKTPKGYWIYKNNPFMIHHFNPNKNINLFNELIKYKEVKKYFEQLDEKKRKSILNKKYSLKNTKKVNERFLKLDGKKLFLKEFLKTDNGILTIKSPMGSGKSNIINYLLENTDKRVLFITNRISIAKDIMKKYNNLKLYSDKTYQEGDNLVCQFDSIWKYDLKNFDMVIIDEFMSLLLHTRNSLNSFNILNKIKFFYALNKQLVLLDAFMFNYESSFLGKRDFFIIENEYREKTKLVEFENLNSLLSKIVKISQTSKKAITISCNTKSMVNGIKKMLENRGKKVIKIDSSTSEEEKETIFSTFKMETPPYDILIWSPSLTVGLSIEFESDYHFHIDEGNTIDVISSIQMLKRNRNAKNIYYYIKERKKFLQYDFKLLLEDFRKELNSKVLGERDIGFLIDVDENGNFKPSRFAEYQFKIEALFNLLQNNNYMSFKTLLKFQFLNDSIIDKSFAESFISKYKKEYKKKRRNL